jgi:hypothetical protein
MRRCRRSSHSHLRSSSCSLFQSRACLIPSPFGSVMVSPSPQLQIEEEEKLHALRKYARDFRCQHMTDAEDFHWDSEDEDYGLAIGHLVIT